MNEKDPQPQPEGPDSGKATPGPADERRLAPATRAAARRVWARMKPKRRI